MTHGIAPTGVHLLGNGLNVLTREVHHAPLASVMVWYGVGSRNEAPGRTGLSHFLEHMMFKGTRRFPYGVLEDGVKRRGGTWNAFTSYDYTAYYEVLPARHVEYGLAIESDRMVNMTFDPDLTVRERGIIVSEREGGENNPFSWLWENFMAEVYRESPYRHPVIGSKEDIRATTAEALTQHYRRFYRPGNATLVVVGDFETERLLDLVRQHFGGLPTGEPVDTAVPAEPEQTAERRCEVRRPGPNPYLLLGYRLPGADHPDQSALAVLAAILSGAAAQSAGAAGMGRSSRLFRRLVSQGVAAWASGGPFALQYGGLFQFSASPVPGVTPDTLERALLAEVDAVRQDAVPADELERARKQARAQIIYGMESAMTQARQLGAASLTRSVDHFDHALERIESVTAQDVLRVAQTYLSDRRRTVGWFIPEAAAAPPEVSAPAPVPAATGSTPDYQTRTGAVAEQPAPGDRVRILDQSRLVRKALPGGATLLVYPATTIPSLFARVQVEAGAAHDPAGKEGVAQLTSRLLTRGTRSYTADALALKTDSLGMSIKADLGRETLIGSLKCLPEDMQTGLGLLAEVLRYPTFPQDELNRARDRMLVGVREANNDTRSVAARTLLEALYPAGHPYRNSSIGTEESLGAIDRDDLEEFHRRHYGPNGAIITVVGNVDPDQVERAVTMAFAGWTGGAGRPEIPAVHGAAGSSNHVTVAGKTQTDIALGWTLVDRSHPDFLALDVLATLFGGNGTPATSRLFRNVRERHGLSYYQYASFSAATGPNGWTCHMGVSPARVDFALETLRQELDLLAREPVPADELEALKSFLQDYPAVQHESVERVAARLAEMERYGLGLDYLDRYPEQVTALTPAQLQEVARRHLTLDRLTVVTAGPEATGA